MGNPLTGQPGMNPPPVPDLPFVNEVRLNAPQWAAVLVIVALAAALTPWVWKKVERFDTGRDYRIPYALSKDYWLYHRRLEQAPPGRVFVLGDSVIWGEYVSANGTLPHFLNGATGAPDRFVNCGINGLFPLALGGLVEHYAKPLRGQKVILHENVLWMTSPKADLSTEKEEAFNHATLVPQFRPRIPSYRADANDRFSALVERNIPFLGWVSHLQTAYFGGKSILKWTLEEEDGHPPRHPNASRNPFAQITLQVPGEPENDPQRGPRSPRHKAWSTNAVGTTQFEWVPLERSLQWRAFQQTVEILRNRGNHLLVVLGPFNEHLLAEENRPAYRKIRDGISEWLSQNQISHVVPEVLPSLLYADASHPLTEGYELLAKRLLADPVFQEWLARP